MSVSTRTTVVRVFAAVAAMAGALSTTAAAAATPDTIRHADLIPGR